MPDFHHQRKGRIAAALLLLWADYPAATADIVEAKGEGDCHWVTLDNGQKVFIQGGEITKGPKGLVGKKAGGVTGKDAGGKMAGMEPTRRITKAEYDAQTQRGKVAAAKFYADPANRAKMEAQLNDIMASFERPFSKESGAGRDMKHRALATACRFAGIELSV